MWGVVALAALAVIVAGGVLLYLGRAHLGLGYTTELLLERDVDANPKAALAVDASGTKITLPPGTVAKKTKLTVSRVSGLESPSEATLGTTVEVRLGDLHRFEEPLSIAIPYDPAKVKARRGKRPHLLALSYDPAKRSWEPIPFTIDEARRVIRVDTPHLSMFSAVFPKEIKVSPTARIEYATFPYAVDFEDASTAENILKGSSGAAAEEGWKASMEWFGIGQAFATLGEEAAIVSEFGRASAVLGKVNELAGNLGVAFALVQLGLDMSKEGNQTAAVGNALKAIGYDALSRYGTSAMKIAGVGVFMIDYSLGKFADAAWSGRKDIWAKVLTCYYKAHPRTHAEWMTRLKTIVSKSTEPNAASAAIRAEVEQYANKVWEDETELGLCQAEVGAGNSGSGGGLNAKMQKDLSAEYSKQLFSDLRPEFSALAKWATEQQQQRTHALLEELRGKFNQKTIIEVVLQTKDAKRKLEGFPVAITTRKDPKLWQGKTDAAGKFTMEVTSLGYMLYGTPTEVVVTMPPGPDGKSELRKAKLAYRPGKTRVAVDLDGAGGTFEGEMSTSYSGPGIDGPVAMKGPITVVVDPSGTVSAKLEMSTKFTGGRGATSMSSTTTGSLNGTAEGTRVTAKGTVTTRMDVVIKLPNGKEDRRSIPSTSPVTLEATLVSADTLEGKISGNPGAKTIPFKATRR